MSTRLKLKKKNERDKGWWQWQLIEDVNTLSNSLMVILEGEGYTYMNTDTNDIENYNLYMRKKERNVPKREKEQKKENIHYTFTYKRHEEPFVVRMILTTHKSTQSFSFLSSFSSPGRPQPCPQRRRKTSWEEGKSGWSWGHHHRWW